MKTIYFLVIQLLILVVSSQTVEDPCTKPDGIPFISYEKAVACSKVFKLDPKVKKEHIQNLRNLLQFYVFIDIIKQSPDSRVPANLDLYKELDKIEATEYTSEIEFHNAITRSILSANDAHLTYNSRCTAIFTYRQPFPLVALRDENGSLVVKVLDDVQLESDYVEYLKTNHKIDVLKYTGKQVLLINGQLPLDFLQQYADTEVGTSRDPNSRLAQVLARSMLYYGYWSTTYGSLVRTNLIPKFKEISYTFKVGYNEEKVTVPYVVQGPWYIKDNQTLYNNYCTKSTTNSRMVNPVTELESELHGIKKIIELKPDALFKQSRSAANLETVDLNNPTKKGYVVQTYQLNEDTVVLVIPQFSYFNSNILDQEIADHIKFISETKAKNLIIELSNNGGGSLCVSQNLLQYLFPNNYQPFVRDMKFNPAMEQIVRKSYKQGGSYDPTSFISLNGSRYSDADSFLGPEIYRRGNVDSTYTNKYHNFCFNSPYKDLISANQNLPRFNSSNIAIVTNGICYSACAMLVNNLQLNQNVTKVYSVGGDNNVDKQATAASVIGGQIWDLGYLTYYVQRAELVGKEGMPKDFALPVDWHFTLNEVYNNQDQIPLEFQYIPANFRIAYNSDTVHNPFKIWQAIAAEF